MDKTLKIGTHSFQSRLMVGTGKYKDFEETKSAITASGAEVVTVALRRTNMGQDKDEPNLLDFVDPKSGPSFQILLAALTLRMQLERASSQESFWMEKPL